MWPNPLILAQLMPAEAGRQREKALLPSFQWLQSRPCVQTRGDLFSLT
jgi:hypothetical protein